MKRQTKGIPGKKGLHAVIFCSILTYFEEFHILTLQTSSPSHNLVRVFDSLIFQRTLCAFAVSHAEKK